MIPDSNILNNKGTFLPFLFKYYLFSHSPDEIGLSLRMVPDFQSNVHIAAFAFDVGGIEGFGVTAFENMALAA